MQLFTRLSNKGSVSKVALIRQNRAVLSLSLSRKARDFYNHGTFN